MFFAQFSDNGTKCLSNYDVEGMDDSDDRTTAHSYTIDNGLNVRLIAESISKIIKWAKYLTLNFIAAFKAEVFK